MNATKSQKTAYWIATGYMLLAMTWSFVMYHLRPDIASGFFEQFGYPTYLVYPLAWLKLIGLVIVVTNRYNNLKEMVYGAYFLNMCMATVGHLSMGHQPWHAYIGLVAVPVSYLLSNRVRGKPERDFLTDLANPKSA